MLPTSIRRHSKGRKASATFPTINLAWRFDLMRKRERRGKGGKENEMKPAAPSVVSLRKKSNPAVGVISQQKIPNDRSEATKKEKKERKRGKTNFALSKMKKRGIDTVPPHPALLPFFLLARQEGKEKGRGERKRGKN